jgi:chaperonin GroEL (HSP60 family)
MNKQEIVLIMQAAFDAGNRSLCVQNGMDPAQIEESIAKSEMAVAFLLGEVFNKLEEKNLLNIS